MTKETQTQAIAEPFKFKNAALLNRLSEMAQVPYYATACHTLIQAEMAIVELERENATLRAEVERLAAQAAPTEQADLRQLMGMNEAEIDAELIAAGISPDNAVKRADRAIKGALATVRAERRAIEYGAIVHKQVVVMRAAVVAAKLESPEVGIQWIANTLFGPGHYPDIEAARELGGAQALFDKESAELEAFRAAHPAPVADQPSQAPVVQAVQAGEYPPLPEARATLRSYETTPNSISSMLGFEPGERDSDTPTSEFDVFTEAQMRAYVDADRASSGATTAQAVRMLTAEEIKALTAMVWGAPCSGHDLAVFTSAVKAMEALRPGERPMDPADGGRLLEVDACGDPMPSGRTIPPSGVIGGAA